MDKTFNLKKLRNTEILGIIIVSILAPLFHFIYEWSGSNYFVGLISAVNESVWEHSKIIYFPFLIFTIIEFFIVKPDFKRFLAAKAVAMAFIPVVMIAFFYTYTGVLGVESLTVDIISTIVWIFFAFLISYRLYKSNYNLEKYFVWFLILFIAILAVEVIWTIFPYKIPLFQDSVSGGYGFNT